MRLPVFALNAHRNSGPAGRSALFIVFIATAASIGVCQPLDSATAPPSAAQARLITRRSDLCNGPMAAGRPGDFVLQNSLVRVVIAGTAGDPRPFPAGSLIDAALAPFYYDSLIAFFSIYGPESEKRLTVLSVAVVDSASLPAGCAAVEVTARHDRHTSLTLTTRYELRAGDREVRISSVLTNGMDRPMPGLIPGDSVVWGNLTPFVPEVGLFYAVGRVRAAWLAGYDPAEDASLGVSADAPGGIGINNWYHIDPTRRHSALAYGPARELKRRVVGLAAHRAGGRARLGAHRGVDVAPAPDSPVNHRRRRARPPIARAHCPLPRAPVMESKDG